MSFPRSVILTELCYSFVETISETQHDNPHLICHNKYITTDDKRR